MVGILSLAITLRVVWPTLTEFKFSEARLVALVLELTDRGRLPLVGVPSSAGFDHSPLSVYLYLPPFFLTSNPIPATIYGGLIGGAAVALCWWLGRRWPGGGPSGALVAALLFGISPWAVVFTRKIWQVTFVPLLVLAFIGLMVSALITGPTASRPSSRQWHLAWGIVAYAVLIQVHPSAVSLAPALVLWLILFRRRIGTIPLVTGVLLSVLTAVPFLVHQITSGFPALAVLRSLRGATWDLSSIQYAWEVATGRSIHALAGEAYPLLTTVPTLERIFNLVGWLTLLASVGLLWRALTGWRSTDATVRHAAQIDMILLSWLAIPVLVNVRQTLQLHLHFYALIIPAVFLIIGRSAELARNTIRATAPRYAQALAIMGIGMLSLLAIGQVMALVLMARFVVSHDTPRGFGIPLARYLEVADQTTKVASQFSTPEVLIVGQGDSVVVDETPAIFDVLLRNRVSYRFANGQDTAVFPPAKTIVLLTPEPGEAAEWYAPWPGQDLGAGYRLVQLDGSWPQELLEPVEGPRTFENGIEIQSYYWDSGTGTRDKEPGHSTARLWLLWQVLWLSSDDTHFFVELFDSDWSRWGQRDSVGYPVASRQKGDRIISKFEITQQESGSGAPVWARAGLYLYPEIFNLALIDSAGNPVGDAVVTGPLAGSP